MKETLVALVLQIPDSWYFIYILFSVFTGFRKFHRSILRRAVPGPIYFRAKNGHESFRQNKFTSGKMTRLASVGSTLDTIPENIYGTV